MLWHVKSNMTEIGLTMSETMRSSQVGIEYLLEYRVIAEHISMRMYAENIAVLGKDD